MKTLLSLAVCLLILIACNNKKTTSYFNTSRLATETFSIDITKDTTLLTKKGAVIKLPKGTLTNEGNNNVELEIKEAYSIDDMLLAGLTTSSNGQALSSGGMIYINAKDKAVKIASAISVAIPTPFLNPEMKLYKGEEGKDGEFNWTKTTEIPENSQQKAISAGRHLFISNCASCHAIGKDLTGPDLAHIVKRSPRPGEAHSNPLYEFTKNWNKVMDIPYYRCITKFSASAMNSFESLTDQDLDKLYAFIENESELKGLPLGDTTLADCLDSCSNYFYELKRLESRKSRLIDSSETHIQIDYNFDTTVLAVNDDSIGLEVAIPDIDKVSPIDERFVYYQVKIETFGWFNIDMLVSDINGNVESELRVRIQGQYQNTYNLYLAVPSQRIIGPGGLLSDEKSFGFFTKDGKIPLPQNAEAYIIVVGEDDDQLIFTKHKFTTQRINIIDITISKVSKEEFNRELASFQRYGINAKAEDSRHANEIRAVTKEIKNIEQLKPKGCDCNCLIGGRDRAALPDSIENL